MYGPLFGTSAGRSIYRYTENNPRWVFALTNGLHKAGMLHPKTRQFIKAHFSRPEQRRNIREAWSLYRCFDPDLDTLARHTNEGLIDMKLIFGRHDSVITPEQGRDFDKRLTHSALHLFDSGHQLLIPKLLDFIREKDLWYRSK